MQHREPPVHTISADFMCLTLGLDGEYLYSTTSSRIPLLAICLAEKHLAVQERSKSLERIEI